MYIDATITTTLEEVLGQLGLSHDEASSLLREARAPHDAEELTTHQLARVDQTVSRMIGSLAGQDWRRPDGVDRGPDNVNQVGTYDLFHKKTGEHKKFDTFGDLLRWSVAEYGWKM
ncbi:hypothetical protein IV102_27695 [bacterium]|nr:hypothetical protein [bacterium]